MQCKILITFLFLLFTLSINGQDLMADAVPMDKQLKAMESISLAKLLKIESFENPAGDLYTYWDNKSFFPKGEWPKQYKIDLRKFSMPCDSKVVTSRFGPRWGRLHAGTDIAVHVGDTIRAAFSGKVRLVKYDSGGYGKYIIIRHPNGLETLYGHMSKQLVKANQIVKAGEPIGLGGSTGRSTGPHLHFETRFLGKPLNPEIFFSFKLRDVTKDFYVLTTK